MLTAFNTSMWCFNEIKLEWRGVRRSNSFDKSRFPANLAPSQTDIDQYFSHSVETVNWNHNRATVICRLARNERAFLMPRKLTAPGLNARQMKRAILSRKNNRPQPLYTKVPDHSDCVSAQNATSLTSVPGIWSDFCAAIS